MSVSNGKSPAISRKSGILGDFEIPNSGNTREELEKERENEEEREICRKREMAWLLPELPELPVMGAFK